VCETLSFWFLPWQQLKDGEQRGAIGCSVRGEESTQEKKQITGMKNHELCLILEKPYTRESTNLS